MAASRDAIKAGEFYLDREPTRKHMAGPFFSEGTFTKNSEKEVLQLVESLGECVREVEAYVSASAGLC